MEEYFVFSYGDMPVGCSGCCSCCCHHLNHRYHRQLAHSANGEAAAMEGEEMRNDAAVGGDEDVVCQIIKLNKKCLPMESISNQPSSQPAAVS